MGLFNKEPATTNTVNGPSVNITNPVVVPSGSILLIDGKAYRAEAYALVEIPFQRLPVEEPQV
ncbi:hypothetical protein UFOVP1439_14 [uncultured Caudovirales phage]|uniref:Uncharacterized protein n=1 Tax=uncultured Caudovirales phage TaxID=2100421 RepID=A0A6J5QRF8_9CAUD|nr:hypothetical protein UFOVP1085_51 [uncultured Caudovirales phage]CAB4212414.1 hypothetical protein UFOVP1439_14 [uncultured Caudovirales phage]